VRLAARSQPFGNRYLMSVMEVAPNVHLVECRSFPEVKWSLPKARRKCVSFAAAGGIFFVIGIYNLLNGAYMYAVGSAGVGFIYFWLALKNVAKIDDNLDQSLSELSDALLDVDDNQHQ
jgi:hypothetical protein